MAEGSQKSKLTPEQRTEVVAWLKSRGVKGLTCTVCQKSDSWAVGKHKTRLQAADALLGGIGYPQVILTCRNCGHTVLLNSIVLGLDKSSGKGGGGLTPCLMIPMRALVGHKFITKSADRTVRYYSVSDHELKGYRHSSNFMTFSFSIVASVVWFAIDSYREFQLTDNQQALTWVIACAVIGVPFLVAGILSALRRFDIERDIKKAGRQR